MESALWMLKESVQCLENTTVTCGVWNLPIKFSFRWDALRVDKPNYALPKCLLITLMECKSTERHQKGFKSRESGKSSNVTLYIKSHTPNNRGAEVGRNLWRLSRPYLKMKHSNLHIHMYSKWDTDITSLSFDQKPWGPKALPGKEEVGIIRGDLQTRLGVLAHRRLNLLQSQCCLT